MTFWGLLQSVAAVLAIILAAFQLPPHLINAFHHLQDWWSLQSRRRRLLRLGKLEKELDNLNDSGSVDRMQAEFYSLIFFIMYCLSGGLLFAAFQLFGGVVSVRPGFLLATTCLFLLMALVVAGWGMYRFRYLQPSYRKTLLAEVETRISEMRGKLGPSGN